MSLVLRVLGFFPFLFFLIILGPVDCSIQSLLLRAIYILSL